MLTLVRMTAPWKYAAGLAPGTAGLHLASLVPVTGAFLQAALISNLAVYHPPQRTADIRHSRR